MALPLTPVTAVLRVGIDGLALAAVDRNLAIRARREAPSPPLEGAPYPALDHHHVWRWLGAALQDFAESFRVEAIVPTAFGGTAALVDDEGLVLPMIHPAALPPAALRAAFAAEAPAAADVGMETPAEATSLALQLYWQKRLFPDAFARTRWILPHAAYWGHRLTDGGLASEASSLADGGQLIEIKSHRPSTLARREGFQLRLPALREPHRRLGRLAPALAERTDLAASTPVLVGASDRAAAHGLLLAASLDDAALLLARDGLLLVPGGVAPGPGRRTILSLDRRPLAAVDAGAAADAALRTLVDLKHRGPVVIAGAWPEAPALAASLDPHNVAVFTLDDADLWAQGAAFLALLERRPPVPRLPLVRVAAARAPDAGPD